MCSRKLHAILKFHLDSLNGREGASWTQVHVRWLAIQGASFFPCLLGCKPLPLTSAFYAGTDLMAVVIAYSRKCAGDKMVRLVREFPTLFDELCRRHGVNPEAERAHYKAAAGWKKADRDFLVAAKENGTKNKVTHAVGFKAHPDSHDKSHANENLFLTDDQANERRILVDGKQFEDPGAGTVGV